MTVARSTQQAEEVLAAYTPVARSTQQATEVLAAYTPKARATQVAVEVLMKTGIFASASNALVLTQDVGRGQALSASNALSLNNVVERFSTILSASNFLNLQHSVSQEGVDQTSANNVLVLTQSATHNIKFVSASNILSLVQANTVGGPLSESVSSVLSLIQTATHNLIFESLGNTLALSQDVIVKHNSNIHVVSSVLTDLNQEVSVQKVHGLFDVLTLTQDVQVAGPIIQVASNILTLSQTLEKKPSVLNRSATTILSLAQELKRVVEASASSVLELFGTVDGSRPVSNVLTLSQILSHVTTKPASNELILDQAVLLNADWARVVVSNLTLSQALTYLILRSDTECQYTPFVGSGVTVSVPVLGQATLTLTYPFVTPTSTIVLRNPEFNNIDRFEFLRISRKTRGGDVEAFADQTWPKQRVFTITVSALSESLKNQLATFVEDSIGQEIGLLDHENRQWRGIITTPDIDTTHVHTNCNYSVSFTFEGELA